VTFPEEYVLESHAEALLQSQASPDVNDQNNPQLYMGKGKTDSAEHPVNGSPFTYEEMILEDRRLLCQIPRVTQDDHNTTRDREHSKVDEQKELARATDRGLELLREMEGKCMYYFSGWWSYSFCYQKQIRQFHALPAGRGIPHYPPIEDTETQSFILGRFIDDKDEDKQSARSDVAELHTKGGSRYLVQHLRGGTKCDLTGRERKVEVQFHCHPQSTDHIGWIKELTTCSYLMVIYTPRLCDDVAFLPPQQDEVHHIECREILMPDEVTEWEAIKEWYMTNHLADGATAAETDATQPELPIIGGIEVGGHKLVGMEGKVIEKGRVASAGEERVEVVAKRENGEIRKMSKQVLKKYDLDPEKVEEMKRLLEEQANGKDWTLEVVESNGVIKFQGILEEEDEDAWNADSSSGKPREESASDNSAGQKSKKQGTEPVEKPKSKQSSEKPRGNEGSEETFKDDL
jgi:protein OS-9